MADDGWNSEEEQEIHKTVSSDSNDTKRNGGPRYNRVIPNQNWRNGDKNDTIDVSTSLVGKIIGRGGMKIKELQNESGARIFVPRDTSNSSMTSIQLTGSHEARNKARILITKLVEDPPPQKDYGRSSTSGVVSDGTNSPPKEINYSSLETENAETENIYDWKALLEKNMKAKEAYWATLPPILKNFYIENIEIAGMSEKDVACWRSVNNSITVERVQQDHSVSLPKIPNPVHTFEQAFEHYPEILESIRHQNFSKPSPIQSQAWPVLLSGEDLIGIAQTGTGKTLAFLLPALIHIDRQPVPVDQRNGPNVLILAPTRELAIQIDKEVKKYKYKGYKSVCIYGGGCRSTQVDAVAQGVQIVIATPGRLNDLVKSKLINVEAVTYLVLDEADRMLDMGFGPQIRVSLLEIRPNRQTVMTSATWPSGVQRLAELYCVNPIRVIVGSLDLAAVHTVEQSLIFLNDDINEKFEVLLEFIDELQDDDKVIIFCSKRATTITIAADLALKGINFQSIYGGLDQCDREQALEDMREGSVNILVATDVASRGIDINNITHIVNFDFPTSLEEFVHRVGRTGRAGKTGKAITYMSRRDWDKAEGLIKILEEANQVVPQELIAMADRYRKRPPPSNSGRRGGGGRRGGYNRYDY